MGLIIFAKTRWENGRPAPTSRRIDSLTIEEAAHHARSLQSFSLGFGNLLSGILWVNLLQESTFTKLKSDRVSWEYAQLHSINLLDPEFQSAYNFGSVYLSILKEDRFGARELLTRWVKRQPNSWRPHYMLGFLLYYDLDDYKNGAEHMLTAARLPGAPAYLSALGIRLLSETGAIAQALKVSVELFQQVANPESQRRILMRIRDLNYSLQLAAWNQALTKYTQEFRKPPTAKEDLKPFLASEIRSIASALPADMSDEVSKAIAEVFDFRYDPTSRQMVSVKDPKSLGLTGIGIQKNSKEK